MDVYESSKYVRIVYIKFRVLMGVKDARTIWMVKCIYLEGNTVCYAV